MIVFIFDNKEESNLTFQTSLMKGKGGNTAISTSLDEIDLVNSAMLVERSTAVVRSVFIFQLPAMSGFLTALHVPAKQFLLCAETMATHKIRVGINMFLF